MIGRLIAPLLFGIAGVAVLLWLGVWQLQRLDWKMGVLAEIDAMLAAEPGALPDAPSELADRFRPVAVTGQFTGDELHVLVSMKGAGAGFRIISAFEMDGGRRIMVDRGFVPADQKLAPRAPHAATVTGNLHWPDEVDGFTPDADPEGNIWYAREVPILAANLRTEPVLIVANRPTRSPPEVLPIPVDSSAIPNDHLGYAITWFGLAIAWVIMTIALLRRLARRPNKESAR